MKAVFIGDDTEVVNFTTTSIRLRWPDFTPLVATTTTLGVEMAEAQSPDIVLLHDTSTGNLLAQTIQELRHYSAVPLVALGFQPDQLQIISALESGADEYVRLPCGLPEMMARVLAVLRRAGLQKFEDGEGLLVRGDLLVNPATFEAFLGDRRLKLTVTEFRLLHTLASNSGRVVPHQTLERQLWGDTWNGSGLVKKYIQRLRSKLGDGAPGQSRIASVHGVGYRFVAEDRSPQSLEPAAAGTFNTKVALPEAGTTTLLDLNEVKRRATLEVA